jgi:hypothetical protein
VSISSALPGDVTVHYSFAAGTAGPDDVDLTSGSVTIPHGQTTAQIALPVHDDAIDEDAETFSIVLDSVSDGIQLARPQATGTITDDGAAPAASVTGSSVDEGDTGLTDAVVHVHQSHPSAQSVTVDVATADGTAHAPADYAAFHATVGLAPGQTDADVHLAVAGDNAVEPDENFTVKLSNASGATLGDTTATVAVADDDPLHLVVTSPEVTEGDTGTTPATFTVAIEPAPPAGTTVSVDYSVKGLSATIPDDVLAKSRSLEFAAGDGQKQVVVDVVGDDAVEGPDAFRLVLSSAHASDGRPVLPGDKRPGIVLDDDAAVPPPPVNHAPTVDAGAAASGVEGSAIALDATAADEDAGDTLTAAWTYQAGGDVAAGATCAFADASAVDTSLTCTGDGTYTATLTVTDSHGESAVDSTTVTVTKAPPPPPVNHAPTADAGAAAGGAEGSPIVLDASAADEDAGDTLTAAWTYQAGSGVDAGATCTFSATSAVTKLTCTDDGAYTATLTVTDSHGASAVDSTTVTVTNAAPQVDITAPADHAYASVAVPVAVSAAIGGRRERHAHLLGRLGRWQLRPGDRRQWRVPGKPRVRGGRLTHDPCHRHGR